MRKEWMIVWMDIKKLFKSPKIYLLLFFSWFFLRDYVNVNAMKLIAEQKGIGIPPFLYPIFAGEWSYRLFIYFILIMLMADVPFRDGASLYTIQRTGIKKWINGKVMSVFMFSLIYQILFYLLSIVVLLPDLGFANQWGDVIRMVSSNHAQAYASTGNIYAMELIITNYTPIAATLYTFLLSVLIGSMTGLFILFVNQVTKSQLGMILVLIYCCADLFFDALKDFGYFLRVPLVMSWIDLSQLYNTEYQSDKIGVWTAIVILLAINFALVYFIKKMVYFRIIQPIE